MPAFYRTAVVTTWSLPAAATSKSFGKKIAVVGGGASGIFSAIAAADMAKKTTQPTKVIVLEATSKTLKKVAISGGGRCNVLHDTSKATSEILNGYPRGKKELTGLYKSRFTPQRAESWFRERGVQLKTEPDGRMFPITDSSQTIIDTLIKAAQDTGMVEIRKQEKVVSIRKHGERFQVVTQDKKEKTEEQQQQQQQLYDAVILATGSAPIGYEIAQSLGHEIVSPVPSLFTFSTKLDVKEEGTLLHGLSGVSVAHAKVSFRPPQKTTKSKNVLQQEGPLLITHQGVSGPAVLRLSAFGAREFKEANYKGDLLVHWAPHLGNTEKIADALWAVTRTNPKRKIVTSCPLSLSGENNQLPKRLWSSLALSAGFHPDQMWGEASKKLVRKLASQIAECKLQITSKNTFKDEFVTAGGVTLKEINMKTLSSKLLPGLFFCGEVINVDGVTGGFNFMNCWGTGYVAGTSAIEHVLEQNQL